MSQPTTASDGHLADAEPVDAAAVRDDIEAAAGQRRSRLPERPLEQALMTLSLDYRAAQWLTDQADDPAEAGSHWRRGEPALLRLGHRMEAVRLPRAVVDRAAGFREHDRIEEALAGCGVTHAVFADAGPRWYYALVPVGTRAHWDVRGIDCLGEDSYLGVPAPFQGEPPGAHWLLTPPHATDMLCRPQQLKALISMDPEAAGA
ncbi:hypothetical protein ACFP1Z_10530 [Streptomyces gamaensis]|uniref:Uncharacterized protein n=1 Tax=Streptomyces gamaensis TaxID=1763542 RepID=A0ABW0YWM5_9ACTN